MREWEREDCQEKVCPRAAYFMGNWGSVPVGPLGDGVECTAELSGEGVRKLGH